jgi:hypothetical protein
VDKSARLVKNAKSLPGEEAKKRGAKRPFRQRYGGLPDHADLRTKTNVHVCINGKHV